MLPAVLSSARRVNLVSIESTFLVTIRACVFRATCPYAPEGTRVGAIRYRTIPRPTFSASHSAAMLRLCPVDETHRPMDAAFNLVGT
jgi:hypothetical protein